MTRSLIIFFLFLTVVPAMGGTMDNQIATALEKVDSNFIENHSVNNAFVEKYIKDAPLIQKFLHIHNFAIPDGKRNNFEKLLVSLIEGQTDFNPTVNGESVLCRAVSWNMKDAVSAILKKEKANKANFRENLAYLPINSPEMLKLLLEMKIGSINDIDDDGNTLLHIASGDSTQFNKKYMEALISKINIDAKNNEGQTPIIYAISNNLRAPGVIHAIVNFLIKQGADLTARDIGKNTPLLEALRTPRIPNETIESLISKTENFQITNIGGMTPLHLSVVHHPEFIESLYRKNPSVLNKRNSKEYFGGTTPLITAIKWIKIESAEKLIKLGADINKPDFFGATPLFYAKKTDFAEVIAMLESRGAQDADPKLVEENVEAYEKTRPPKDINDAIDLGKCTEYTEFINNELKKNNADQDTINAYFRHAGATGNVPCVELFLSLGADLNNKDEEGFDILMDALYYGNFELLEYLHKEQKMDLNNTTNPPLLILAATNSSKVFKYMLDHGAKMENPEKYFKRALNCGGAEVCQYLVDKYHVKYDPMDSQKYLGNYIKNGKPDFVKFYLNQGGDINTPVPFFIGTHSLLSISLMQGQKDLALFLLDKGIDTKNEDQFFEKSFEPLINLGDKDLIKAYYGRKGAKAELEARDSMGKTPLLLALELKRSEIARLLISLGADVHAKDNLDQTPLHLSVKNGYLLTTKLLLEKGADANAVNYRNKTAYDLAKDHGYSTLEKILEQ